MLNEKNNANEINGAKQKRLTIDQLRCFKGLENLSDDEAEGCIDTMQSLSILFFELFQKNQKE